MTCPYLDKCPAMVSEFTYRKACVEEQYSLYCPRYSHTNHRVPREWENLGFTPTIPKEEK